MLHKGLISFTVRGLSSRQETGSERCRSRDVNSTHKRRVPHELKVLFPNNKGNRTVYLIRAYAEK